MFCNLPKCFLDVSIYIQNCYNPRFKLILLFCSIVFYRLASKAELQLRVFREFCFLENIRDQLKVEDEKAVLVGAILRGEEKYDDNLAELTSLVRTAGAVVVDRFQQKVSRINPATYIGKGKARMLADRVQIHEADVVIFNNDLSPGQIRELENILETKVVDRSELILDIFATRARTKQAKLQVELAQLEYTYPRLTRMWGHLDTVAGAGGGTAAGAVGGVGTRGTGEKQLEIDRRLVNKRITELKRELALIEKRRNREIEARSSIFKICLVGYTNAGKSTLMNTITSAGVFAEDRLFATLDTRTKRWKVDSGIEALLSDTVGFVRNLPHQLVESFKATLAEAVNADLLLHVVDVSSSEVYEQIESVESVLEEIGCKGKQTVVVFNKIDVLKSKAQLEALNTVYPEAICISAKAGHNIEAVAKQISEIIRGNICSVVVTCSLADGKTQGFLKASTEILSEKYTDEEAVFEVKIGANKLNELKSLNPKKIEVM